MLSCNGTAVALLPSTVHICCPLAPILLLLHAHTGVIMTELGRHFEKSMHPIARHVLLGALSWAFKSIPQVCG